jgi:hypothetical protein
MGDNPSTEIKDQKRDETRRAGVDARTTGMELAGPVREL